MVAIIAHRGARSLAPENTLAAARKAHAVGADLWETDVAVTAATMKALAAVPRQRGVATGRPTIRVASTMRSS